MRFSKALIPTVKETPADAEIISHQIMIRAGLMRKLASGTYSYLPAGWRMLTKIMNIVRDEMNAADAQELLLPSVQPIELWQRTGRDVDYGQTMCRFEDRHGRTNVLAPTAEEVITDLAANELNSYKQLPVNLYQVSFKFRDEFRPRFGVLRSREFIMKDAYSFHENPQCLEKTYRLMYDTYCKIFKRCGLEYVIVEAETGEMGGSGSHQFTIPCDNGEDIIVHTEDGSRAWNIEKAPVDPPASMTETAEKENQIADQPEPHEIHTPNAGTIEDVCKLINAKPNQLMKTLIYTAGQQGDNQQTVAVLLRADHELNPEKLTQILAGQHIEMATPDIVENVTGAAVGFAGPIDIARKVDQLLIDNYAAAMPVAITGANKTDYHIKNVVPGRDFPLNGEKIKIADLRNAVESDTYEGKKLKFSRGIEVGQVFKLGTKYSEKLNATILDADGKNKPCLMGCYGIGINRILASAIETMHDEDGPVFPVSIAPWQVIITTAGTDDAIDDAAEKIYADLTAQGIEVLLDDRDVRGGVKFKDADLLGIPVRVTVGKKSLADGKVEMKLRREKDRRPIELEKITTTVKQTVESLFDELNG